MLLKSLCWFNLNEKVSDFVDPFQFAHKSNRSTDNAIAHAINNIYAHLDLPWASIRLMFFEFSSAFNTIQPHLLCDKLLNMNICPSLITWIIDHLTLRPQFVRFNPSIKFAVIVTNTGAPQGTALSPDLFSLYISDRRATHDNGTIDKYAGDTVLARMVVYDDCTKWLTTSKK